MGMQIETRRAFSEGEIVSLRFPAPQGEYNLTVSGEVVRAARGSIGIEFFDLEDWIFDELCAYVYQTDDDRALVVSVGPTAATAP